MAAADDEVSELVELRQQVEDLRRAVRAGEDFVAIAAHELRNPMTPIVAAAELALIAAESRRHVPAPRHGLVGAPAASDSGLYEAGDEAA